MLIFGPQFAEKDIFLLNVTSVFWSPKIKQLGFELASENFDLFMWNRREAKRDGDQFSFPVRVSDMGKPQRSHSRGHLVYYLQLVVRVP